MSFFLVNEQKEVTVIVSKLLYIAVSLRTVFGLNSVSCESNFQ